ncbi:MAG TPA: type II toxin-antitoxin system VapB family antitoxin [Tepidisphaeraceae bacterium]
MKTTIDIPDDMLKHAMEYSGATTKREAILAALDDFNRKHRLTKARKLLGTFDNLITVKELRSLRNARSKRHGLA